jgi:hypothetical protein
MIAEFNSSCSAVRPQSAKHMGNNSATDWRKFTPIYKQHMDVKPRDILHSDHVQGYEDE